MSGLDDRVTGRTASSIPAQVADVARAALTGRRGLGVAIALAIVIVAGVVAPGPTPGAWVWVRVAMVTLLAGFALASIAGVTADHRSHRDVAPFVVWGCLVLGVAISLTFSVLTATLAIIILALLLTHLSSGTGPQGMVFWTIVATLTPIWVWSALETWDRSLLILVPVAAIGMISLEHALRSGLTGSPETEQVAAWIGIVIIGSGLLITTLVSDIDPSWVAAGNVALVVLVATDLFIVRHGGHERLPSFTLPALALATLTLSWLIAL